MRTRRMTACLMALAMAASQAMCAPGNFWNRLRYSGGTVQAKVNPFDWNTSLKVTADDIELVMAYRRKVRIRTPEVTRLSYGREAYRRVADMVALSLVFTPLTLFGLLHESKIHFIGIEYKDEDGKPSALLLEAHKDDYKAMLQALKVATGKPVENAP
jgi:hypothetical protein